MDDQEEQQSSLEELAKQPMDASTSNEKEQQQPLSPEKPAVSQLRLGPDKMQVCIMRAQTSRPLNAPYVVLTLGDRVRRTTVAKPAAEWNESFEFTTSFHAQLFGTLQVDVYDRRWVLADEHVGRAEIKLNLITGWPESFTRDQPMALTLSRRVSSRNIGAVELRFLHRFKAAIDASYYTDLHAFKPLSEVKVEEVEITPAPPLRAMTQEVEEALSHAMPRGLSGSGANETLQYFYQEDADDGSKPGFMERLGSLILSKETSTVLQSIRSALLAYGQGMDLSHADIVRAIVVLEKYYLTLRTTRTGEIVRDLGVIEKARHFYRHAMAAYGWKGLNFFGKGGGIIKDSIKRDADRRCVLQYLRIPDENLLAFELETVAIFRPSYFISIDQATESLVLCVRGTMSTTDTLTDLVCEYVKWRDGLVHSGIKAAAEWFIQNVVDDLVKFAQEHHCRNLVLAGHSLGAGTVTVLAMMMVDHLNKFAPHPDGSQIKLHAYGYAAPPIVSLNLGKRYAEYISTFVFEDDAICRLSYGHMMDLKSMILCAVDEEKRKPSVWSAFLGNQGETNFADGSGPQLNTLALCRESLRKPDDMRYQNLKLYLAGTIYYMYYDDPTRKPFSSLVPKYKDLDLARVQSMQSSTSPVSPVQQTGIGTLPTVRRGGKEKLFKKVYMEVSNPENFDELIVKRTMLLEHIPNVYDRAFERAMETLMLDLGASRSQAAYEPYEVNLTQLADASDPTTEFPGSLPGTLPNAVSDS